MNEAEKIQDAPLPTSAAQLLAQLDALSIAYELHHHAPLFRVCDGAEIEANIPGIHCRNLFLRDKKGVMFLVTAANETAIDLKKLEKLLGCGRLSFGSAERLWTHLGVRAGSVCPFAIVNDTQGAVTIILDAHMMAGERVNYHPMENDKTIGLSPSDLVRFIENTGHKAHIMDLGAAAPTTKVTGE